MKRMDSGGALVHEFLIRLDRSGDHHALAVMAESGLTLPQIVALHHLEHAGPSAVSAVARELRLSLSATSALVQRLVDEGMITRTEDPEDRRQKRLALTRRGGTLIERITAERTSGLGRGIGGLPASLQAELLDVLARVVSHLRGVS